MTKIFILSFLIFFTNGYTMTVKEATIIVGKYGLVPDHPDYLSKENKEQLMEALKLLKEKKIKHKALNILAIGMCCNWAYFKGARVGRCETITQNSDQYNCSDVGAYVGTVCYASSTICPWSKVR